MYVHVFKPIIINSSKMLLAGLISIAMYIIWHHFNHKYNGIAKKSYIIDCL